MSAGANFIDDLLGALPDMARLRAHAVLIRYAGQTVYLPTGSKADRRRQVALNLLKNSQTPAEAAAVIAERFGVTRRQAARDVQFAKKNV
jgi:hypothetical protein